MRLVPLSYTFQSRALFHIALEARRHALTTYELDASVDDAETVVLGVTAGLIDRAAFTEWVRSVIVRR